VIAHTSSKITDVLTKFVLNISGMQAGSACSFYVFLDLPDDKLKKDLFA
jgi:hypothetical protein